jgi:ribonuclease P protein component
MGARMSLVKQFAYSRQQRLDTHAVGVVLKCGKRLASTHRNVAPTGVLFTAKVFVRAALALPPLPEVESVPTKVPTTPDMARLAIAAPKRLFKRAVDRNRIKRWVREAFRQHALRLLPADVLITINAKAELVKPEHQDALKVALMAVLDASGREARRSQRLVTPVAPSLVPKVD